MHLKGADFVGIFEALQKASEFEVECIMHIVHHS